MECVIRSLGYGVYHVTAPDALAARSAMGQVGRVLEVWSDPEEAGSHAAVLESGFSTSKWEASVAADLEVASSVRRAAACSPPRLPDEACPRPRLQRLLGAARSCP